MRTRGERLGGRFGRLAAASVLAWAAAVGAAWWYMRHQQPAHLRALPLTHADSVGLPLVAWALAVAAVIVVANLVAAAVLLRRRRRMRAGAAARRPAG